MSSFESKKKKKKKKKWYKNKFLEQSLRKNVKNAHKDAHMLLSKCYISKSNGN